MVLLATLFGGEDRLRSTQGKIASVLTVLIILAGIPASGRAAGSVVFLILLSPIIWWFCWGIGVLLSATWDGLIEGNPPEITVGRAWQSSSERKLLRQDTNARVVVDKGGILMRQRYWFVASGTPPFRLSEEQYRNAEALQDDEPVLITTHRDRAFYWYRDEIYWTNNWEYTSDDIKALLFARERQHQRELDHAHAVMAASTSPAVRKREPIPREVKLALYRRDDGKCVECGSDFEIQYDHIIPLALNGSNTAENLQLLCARCNQQKGGKL